MKKSCVALLFIVCGFLSNQVFACTQDQFGIYFVNDKQEAVWVEIAGYPFDNSPQTILLTNPLQQVLPNSSFEFCFTQHYRRYLLKQAQPITHLMSYDISRDVFKAQHGALYILATDGNFEANGKPPRGSRTMNITRQNN